MLAETIAERMLIPPEVLLQWRQRAAAYWSGTVRLEFKDDVLKNARFDGAPFDPTSVQIVALQTVVAVPEDILALLQRMVLHYHTMHVLFRMEAGQVGVPTTRTFWYRRRQEDGYRPV